MQDFIDEYLSDPEVPPTAIHVIICPANPLQLVAKRGELEAMVAASIDAIDDARQEGTLDTEDLEALQVLRRRREAMLKWIDAVGDDDPLIIDVAPGYGDGSLSREDEDPIANEPTIIERLAAAINEEHRYWLAFCHEHETLDPPVMDGFKELAESAFQSANTLTYSGDLRTLSLPGGDSISLERGEWAQSALAHPTVAFLALSVADKGIHKSAQAVERTAKILSFVLEHRPNAATSAFLARLAQLYIWGFDSETYIVARAVLEQLLSPEQYSKKPPLFSLILSAEKEGWLTPELQKEADHIRDDGNLVIHEFPNAHVHNPTPLHVIESLWKIAEFVLERRGFRDAKERPTSS